MNSLNTRLQFFTDPNIIAKVNRSFLARFLEGFVDSLPREATVLLNSEHNYERFCAAAAAQFSATDTLGAPLLKALMEIETLARPENAALLEDAISRLPSYFDLNPNFHPLHRSLYLWMIAERTPGVTWPLPSPTLSPPEFQQEVTEGTEGRDFEGNSATQNTPPILQPAIAETGEPATCNLQPSTSGTPSLPPVKDPEPAQATAPAPPPPIENQSSKIENPDFTRLARLSPVEYDRVRLAEAKRLHLRVRVLDAAVAQCRAELRVQDEVLDFPDIEPWPEPVNGAQLLTELSDLFSRRLALPPGGADAMAFWVHLPHVLEAFHIVPRLSLYSLKPGSGKTTALDILTLLVPRALRTESVSLPVIYRLVHKRRVTLLLDELDTYLPQSEKHRGLLNAGHKRGARTYRCAGDIIRGFNAFAAAVLASLGPLPSTLRDRSIEILMRKANPGEIAEPFDPLHVELETTLGRKLARWAKDNLEALKACKPTMPPGVYNRLADNWRPLFAVAQLAGGDWPARALAAFKQFTAEPPPAPDLGLTLLADIRQIFAQSNAEQLFSYALVDGLCAIPERPWSSAGPVPNNGSAKAINEIWLARQLRRFGVRPRNLRINEERAKGYERADFMEAFAKDLG
ncbi:MAG TPA: DUF3631 domain-containing protein [Candidatus Binatia bacterium]|jgi:putative DNA primase/helicase|nr:DUF3631 domain-containing protein [Candidatus Binatia bacterium]